MDEPNDIMDPELDLDIGEILPAGVENEESGRSEEELREELGIGKDDQDEKSYLEEEETPEEEEKDKKKKGNQSGKHSGICNHVTGKGCREICKGGRNCKRGA